MLFSFLSCSGVPWLPWSAPLQGAESINPILSDYRFVPGSFTLVVPLDCGLSPSTFTLPTSSNSHRHTTQFLLPIPASSTFTLQHWPLASTYPRLPWRDWMTEGLPGKAITSPRSIMRTFGIFCSILWIACLTSNLGYFTSTQNLRQNVKFFIFHLDYDVYSVFPILVPLYLS